MKKLGCSLSLAALMAFSTLAAAQSGPPPEILDILKEGKIPVLIRVDVADELGLSASQREKIAKGFESTLPSGGGRPPSFLGGGMMRDMIRGRLREAEAKCLSHLTASQKVRLSELNYQWLDTTLVYRKEFRRSLKITKEQGKGIGRIESDAKKNRTASGPAARSSRQERESLAALLTPDQLDAIRKLGGAPFQFSTTDKTYVRLPGS